MSAPDDHDEHEATLVFPAPLPIKEALAQKQAQEQGDYEDVTFTGPVFPRVSSPGADAVAKRRAPGHGSQAPFPRSAVDDDDRHGRREP